uniref:Uncharacterized protein n=1 Tax=Lygus hesperus TaxID=30085 RepID=A0A0K8TE34_LYGHE
MNSKKKGRKREKSNLPRTPPVSGGEKIRFSDFVDPIYPRGVCPDCKCDEEIMNQGYASSFSYREHFERTGCWRHGRIFVREQANVSEEGEEEDSPGQTSNITSTPNNQIDLPGSV